ncbi:anthranilate phosphoribosyltransferase [Tanticharoenia sakaeratensis]|uniref:Anthranilate phosphoribosyltransferase n=1 Tax=Tanticharoenia sakaeratensis NBRC 103193 TaxID=1231623 RepID=A0A0D6MIP0_9PROT|nr:anthranilate phosphoribosyltransferase [Tanticharoenia sakaeratensis]GAN53351.1 anthranilate phosphoribosyltransferase [Tanticharoenia sakaeratensis NBRC 103193]GBQ20898.1 anthranilate phosphoribosyltransferase [Tanticharoenia sakaeratensis NBRC 103193]
MTADDAFHPLLLDAVSGRPLGEDAAERAFGLIMEGAATDIQVAAFLTALHVRGETAPELLGAVRAVRARMAALPTPLPDAIDVCGTGGDGLGTLNVSTAVAFVLAGLGVPVAKHGNRALSSRSGATDVLAELGVASDATPDHLARHLRERGLVFLNAPAHHPAMRHAATVRRGLGFRTLFNLVGPLCNPARVRRQVVGVFDPAWLEPVARTLASLGSTDAWVIHGEINGRSSGADEATLAGPTHVAALENGHVSRFSIDPRDAGLQPAPIDAISGGDPAFNAQALRAMLGGARGAYRDTVLLNAAIGLHVAGHGQITHVGIIQPRALAETVARAAGAIDDGRALAALERARGVSVSA